MLLIILQKMLFLKKNELKTKNELKRNQEGLSFGKLMRIYYSREMKSNGLIIKFIMILWKEMIFSFCIVMNEITINNTISPTIYHLDLTSPLPNITTFGFGDNKLRQRQQQQQQFFIYIAFTYTSFFCISSSSSSFIIHHFAFVSYP